MSHVVGIDIGTSGIKIGAMDENANLSFISKQSYSLIYPKRGWMEIDVNDVWEKTECLLNKTVRRVSENGGKVDAISLSSFCNSSVFMDRTGNALANGIMYMDQRSKEQASSIRQTIGDEELYRVTRNRLEPGMYTATTLLWVLKNDPSLYEKTYKWGNLSTFILNKLTNRFVMDWTQTSFTGLFDVINYKWSKEFCQKIGIDQSILPEVTDPCEHIGYFKAIPVIAGAGDTACSTLALGMSPGRMFESVGTSNVLTVCTDNPQNLDTRFLNRCYIIKDQWLSHGAMSTPGATIQWFYKTFLEEKGSTSKLLEEIPKQSPVGSNGVFFLPYMQGERSPIWDPKARGVFAGLHLNTSKADMLRSILEGIAFGLRQINGIIEESYGLQPNSFPSIGGGSKNKVWAQIKSNVLKKKINIQEVSETAVYGCCLVASKSAGYFDELTEASDYVNNRTIKIIEPDPHTFSSYDDLYAKFIKLYPSLKDFFEEVG